MSRVIGVFDQVWHKPDYNHGTWLEACKLGFRNKSDCTVYVAKKGGDVRLCFPNIHKAGYLMSWLKIKHIPMGQFGWLIANLQYEKKSVKSIVHVPQLSLLPKYIELRYENT